ncbi:hypothetical protein DFH08DRAFT_1078342 [Mycena albidolilacea]|uniref:Uncharacterized protein n=1 Tax=Mycena albidolilacea TaxID=1033008 RepID=A0AAD7A7G1_9AGAR|nr:hypothetical protein DFH08DRAFT_1078342 [Mycena albidolilacea]
MLPPFQSTHPPSRPTAPSARRIYLALRGAVFRRCRGDQDSHVARSTRDPARYASKAALPILLQSSRLLGSRPSPCTTEKTAPHAPAVCVPSAPLLRGAAAPLLALSLWTTRILVSLRARLGTACPRCEPASRASFSIIFFGVVQSGIYECLPTAIFAVFSHTPSFSVHCVVPATRLSLGTRSHNRRCQTALQSQFEDVQYRIRALGPTPLEACSSTISLAMCEMLSAALGHPARTPLTPPSIQQSRASSDAPDAFSTLTAARCPGDHLKHHDSVRDPPQARSTVPATRSCHPTGSTPHRYEHRSDPATSYTRSTRRWRSRRPHRLVAFPHTVTLQQCTAVAACACRTPQHHLHHLLRARWLFPTAGAPFIASSRTKCVSSKYHSPRSTRTPGAPQHGTHHPSRAQQRQPLPIARAPVVSPPPVATVSSSSLSSAPVRPREYDAQHRRTAQQVQRAFPVARAAFIASPRAATILCAHAALRSKPRPAAHRERDVRHPRRVTLRPSPIAP